MPEAWKFFGSSPASTPPRRAKALIMGSREPSRLADPASARYSRWRENQATIIDASRSEEHTSELQSLMRISYAVFCSQKKKSDKITLHAYLKHTQHRSHTSTKILNIN